MTATLLESSLSSLSQEEAKTAQNSSTILSRHLNAGENLKLQIVEADSEEIFELPASAVVTLLLGILRMIARVQ